MERRGAGVVEGRKTSVQRADAMAGLLEELRDLSFPIRKEELLRNKGQVLVRMPEAAVPLGDLLANLHVGEFTSPEHVVEVLRVNWQDFADVFTLGADS